jgi:catechol 2,3-dioxygenase-like lactoylglutathione lyase family enzyme
MRIGLASIYVEDQDQAERFYTEVLGFKVKTSAPYGPDELAERGRPRGARRGAAGAAPGRRAGAGVPAGLPPGRPVLSLRTNDCQGEAERLRAMGVRFTKEPGRMPYGGTDAVFDDTYGNLINLHQD